MAWRALDQLLIERGMQLLGKRQPDYLELTEQYWGPGTLERFQEEEATETEVQQFMAWAFHDWRPEPGGLSAAEELAMEDDLSPLEREVIVAMNRSATSAYQVVRIEAGRGVELEDILQGGKVFVHDRSMSRSVTPWALLFARVYPAGPFIFCTACSFSYPPRWKEFIVDFLTPRYQAYRKKNPGASWLEFLRLHAELFGLLSTELRERMSAVPELRNQDNEEYVLTQAEFAIDQPDEWIAKLREVSEMHEEGPGHFVWVRAKDHRILGNFTVTGPRLRLETNSSERCDRAIAMLSRLGSLTLLERKEQGSADLYRQVQQRRREGRGPAPEPQINVNDLPEIQQFLLGELDKHYATWPETPLPALRGKTPRQALATRRGRQEVIDLIRDMEYHDKLSRLPGPKYEWNKLRRQLGLPEE
jgi:hypothetical protein